MMAHHSLSFYKVVATFTTPNVDHLPKAQAFAINAMQSQLLQQLLKELATCKSDQIRNSRKTTKKKICEG
jgi:hypothetical protein